MGRGLALRLFLTAVVSGVALLAPTQAFAHDHGPPRALIVSPRDSVQGRMYTSTWARGHGRYCSVGVADGVPGSPHPVQWLPGEELAVRFETRQRPARLFVDGYLLGDPFAGVPLFGRVEIPHELRRARIDGTVVWEAVLDAPPSPDLYIDLTALWKDVDGCGMQSASWAFWAGLLPF